MHGLTTIKEMHRRAQAAQRAIDAAMPSTPEEPVNVRDYLSEAGAQIQRALELGDEADLGHDVTEECRLAIARARAATGAAWALYNQRT